MERVIRKLTSKFQDSTPGFPAGEFVIRAETSIGVLACKSLVFNRQLITPYWTLNHEPVDGPQLDFRTLVKPGAQSRPKTKYERHVRQTVRAWVADELARREASVGRLV